MTVPSISLEIRMSSGARLIVQLNDSLEQVSVLSLKETISNQQQDCPPERQRLIYKGRILDDQRMLSDYGVVPGATLHLVKSSAPSTAASTTTATAPSSATTQPPSFPPPANPFQQAGGGTPSPFGGSMPSPDQMAQMMNSPMMQSVLDNPDLMRSLMEANPQMRQMLDSNPQLREVFNNPELMRQSMEMMRNPNAMQHMQRQQDLAMSQLENIPGGFAALSSMYRNIQEPMMDASMPQEQPTQRTATTTGDSGATGTAMPNPWGTSNTNTTTTTPNAANASTGAAAASSTNPWGSMMNNPAAAMANNPWTTSMQQPPNPQQLEQTLQMLENPIMAQMMDQMLTQNPELMTQMMQSNPTYQQMARDNPMAAQMMSDPNFVRAMMNPQTLRAMMQLQQAFGGGTMPPLGSSMPPSVVGGSGTNASASGTMPPAAGGMDFSQLLNQFQSTGLNPHFTTMQSSQQQQAPADRFRVQLASLRDMGFDDEMANIRALQAHHGNLNRAVDDLLMNVGTSGESAPAPAADTTSTSTSSTTEPSPADAAPEEPKGADDKKND